MPAELRQHAGMAAVEFVHAQADLAAETSVCQLRQGPFGMGRIMLPDAVGHDSVEAEAERGGPAAKRVQELRIEKRFTAAEAENSDAIFMSIFQKTQCDLDV